MSTFGDEKLDPSVDNSTISTTAMESKTSSIFLPLSRVDTHSTTKGQHEKEAEGRWGEAEEGGAHVVIDDAINEFQELRHQLSKRSHANSSHGTIRRRKTKDEEEGESASEMSFVDLEEYLQRTNREKESSGIIPKKIGVSFRDLKVSGTGSGSVLIHTFPQEMLSLVGYDIINFFVSMFSPKPPVKNIIQGFSGVVRPGEMLLVLGKPGSGSSTFLRALTNQRRDFTNIDGEVHYAGLPFELAKGKYRGEIMFNGEEDDHFPTLRVDQTLRFALKTKTPHKRTPGTSRSEFVNEMLDLFTNMFGMKHVLGTIVGNQFVRGVSGGERKRVSIMEALASRATINAFDNSTRGLDSSTAIDYIRSLRILTKLTAGTTIVTLYQAGEQIYREFDKVCLIDDGRQIFFGKASDAREYFESLGFVAAPRITTSDFLTTITDAHERKIRPGMEGKVPTTPEALEAAFRKSKHWIDVQEELTAYDRELEESSQEDTKKFSKAVKEDKSKIASKGSPYTVSFPMQVWYLLQRDLQLQLQDTVALRSKFVNVIVLGLIIGGMFYNIPRTSEGAFSIGGVLFFNIIVVGWMQMIEAINMAIGRSVAAKQTAFGFYRPSALVLAKTIADMPVVAVQSIIFTLILYWMAGLVADAGKFFIQLLFVFITVVCLTAFYRAIGSFSKDMNVSIRMAFLGLNILALFAGYVQPYKNMKSWVYKWIFYVNPISYAQEAIMINQFHGMELECSPSQLIPGVPGASIENQVCSVSGGEPMSKIVSGTRYIQQFNYSPEHLWRNFGIVIAFAIFYIVVAMIGVETMSFGGSGGSTKILTKKPEESKLPTTETKAQISTTEKDGPEAPLGPIRTAASAVKTNGSAYTWRDVSYTIGTGAGEKKLLHEISGFVKPGRITALMGSSGAGKTTLLDNLASRKRVGTTSGEFLMNGKHLAADFERSTAFVEQQDVHDWSSTVREAFQFSALLRQPPNIPKEEKFAFVEEIIRLLELEPLADALIGQPGFGLSVEERKRVTIGVELAAAPQELMFLDEPTSGLDSNGALSIVRFLRKLADESGLAILCTIHQPSSILFEDFDDLLLLTNDGREAYFGPIGEAGTTVISYFQRHGAAPAALDANPAEYILETIREAPGARTWPEIWQSSPENNAALEEIETIITTRKDIPVDRTMRTLEYAMPLLVQIQTVTKRVWLHYWRDASYGYSKVFTNLSMGIISGLLYFKSGNTVLELQSRAFSAFMVMILSPMIITSVQPKFLEFRNLYEARERNSKIYSAPAWLTAMALVEIPYAIFGTLFFYLPFYYMIGLPKDSNTAGYDFLYLMVFEIWAPHAGMWIASMCPDMTIISIVNPLFFVITNGVTGIFVPYASLPRFYSSWLYWVNPLTWLARGMVGNVASDIKVTCGADELVTFQPPTEQTCGEYAGDWLSKAFGYIVDLNATQDCQYCQFKSGSEFLETINIQHSTRWREFGIFCAYLVSNIVLIYALYWAFREYRWGRLFAKLRSTRSK